MGNQRQFMAAVNIINVLPENGIIEIPLSKKLNFYGLFKVATEGQNRQEKPKIYKVTERMKWKSWKALDHLSKEEAMRKYVEEFCKTLKKIYDSGVEYSKKDLYFLKNISKEDIAVLVELDESPETKKEIEKLFSLM